VNNQRLSENFDKLLRLFRAETRSASGGDNNCGIHKRKVKSEK
jgi:hypothetical protein